MLKKSMRKRLLERNWVDIAKSESNPYQMLRRFRDEGNRAINDLALLAQKLPAETLKDIFNYTNISKLIHSLLAEPDFRGGRFKGGSALDDREKTELAALMVGRGVDFCIKKYSQRIETDSILNESIISKLKNSKDICDTIAFKMKMPHIHTLAEKEGLIYLFNFNKIEEVHETRVSEIKSEDTKKFIRFLEDERKEAPISIINKINPTIWHENTVEFEFTDIGEYRYEGFLEIDMEGKNGSLFLKNKKDGNVQLDLEHSLIIKIENDNLYVYKKKIEVSQ